MLIGRGMTRGMDASREGRSTCFQTDTAPGRSRLENEYDGWPNKGLREVRRFDRDLLGWTVLYSWFDAIASALGTVTEQVSLATARVSNLLILSSRRGVSRNDVGCFEGIVRKAKEEFPVASRRKGETRKNCVREVLRRAQVATPVRAISMSSCFLHRDRGRSCLSRHPRWGGTSRVQRGGYM
jgi:hypothetical protein